MARTRSQATSAPRRSRAEGHGRSGAKAGRPGWAFLTRARSEHDLVEELGEEHLAEEIAEGVVASASRPQSRDETQIEPAFARQAMQLDGPPAPLHVEQIADRLARAIARRRPKGEGAWTWSLEVVAPDSKDPHDPRRAAAEALERALPEALLARLDETMRSKQVRDPRDAERLVQAWVIDEHSALVGVTMVEHAISRIPGGKLRLKRPTDAPSRAGLKLEEAIGWIGVGPDKGDVCVDLGAAPGGWSQVAVARGATVLAIDPAKPKVDLPRNRFTHVKQSAFEFAPAETLDWLLCDMAWRPLEVALLIAKWGRRVWARQLIANFKLPMKKKAAILRKVVEILESGGWRGIRARQLYYDRDEVTLFAWLDPNIARKGAQAPFHMRGKSRGRGGPGPANRPKSRRDRERARGGRAGGVPRRGTTKKRPRR